MAHLPACKFWRQFSTVTQEDVPVQTVAALPSYLFMEEIIWTARNETELDTRHLGAHIAGVFQSCGAQKESTGTTAETRYCMSARIIRCAMPMQGYSLGRICLLERWQMVNSVLCARMLIIISISFTSGDWWRRRKPTIGWLKFWLRRWIGRTSACWENTIVEWS